jgi:hypothetical protein
MLPRALALEWQRGAYAERASLIISRARALVELDARYDLVPTERMIAAAVEAAVATLHHLKLAFAQDTSPALWAAVGTVVHLRSLHLYALPQDPFTDWEDLGPWDLPLLRRLALDLEEFRLSEHYEGICAFLRRCSLPGLQELLIRAAQLESMGNAPAVVQFLSNHPALISLTADGPRSLSNTVIQHTLAETVTLRRIPGAAVDSLSPRIRTLRISKSLNFDGEDGLLAFLEALVDYRPLDARLACVKLNFTDKNSMRSQILPFAHRLREQGIALLDANDKPYHS